MYKELYFGNIEEELEKLNSISKGDYYIYTKLENKFLPLILEIKGNNKTPYEGGVFFIEINNEEIKFVTKICSIYVNSNTGEFLDKIILNENNTIEGMISYIKEEIFISPNDTKLIENELEKWTGKETYFKYLAKIKSYTQKYANKNGLKIKADSNLLSNLDFSEYVNKKVEYDKNQKMYKRFINEIRNENKNILYAKDYLDLKIENIYFCPFNNLKHMYFEFLGEKGTPYEGGVFEFLYEIPQNYPFRLGKCVFRTNIFHNKFKENSFEICDYEIVLNFNLSWSIYFICLYYYKMMNKYDYICFSNKKAKNLMLTNFKEYLKEVKIYAKKYANIEGIKFTSDINLIEKSSDQLIIESPMEPDYMPAFILSDFDKNIKEEEINIIFKNIFVNDIIFKVLNTEYVVDICIKLRNYIIENKQKIKRSFGSIEEYKNLLPELFIPNQKEIMAYNIQIGCYNIKNNDIIRFRFNIPTCSFNFKKE